MTLEPLEKTMEDPASFSGENPMPQLIFRDSSRLGSLTTVRGKLRCSFPCLILAACALIK